MNDLPRETVNRILDYCSPSAYISLIETGFVTAYPVDQKQYEIKKTQYYTDIRNRRVANIANMLKDGNTVISSDPPVSNRDTMAYTAQLLSNISNEKEGFATTLAEFATDCMPEYKEGQSFAEYMSEIISVITPAELQKLMCPEIMQLGLKLMQFDPNMLAEMGGDATMEQFRNRPGFDDVIREHHAQLQPNGYMDNELIEVNQDWFVQINEIEVEPPSFDSEMSEPEPPSIEE